MWIPLLLILCYIVRADSFNSEIFSLSLTHRVFASAAGLSILFIYFLSVNK
jgi:hypothetical protein